MLSIEEKILTLNSLHLLPVAALRFTLYAFYWCPTMFIHPIGYVHGIISRVRVRLVLLKLRLCLSQTC